MKNALQIKMSGHGVLMIFCTLLFGVLYWMHLIGGSRSFPMCSLNSRFPERRKAGARPTPVQR